MKLILITTPTFFTEEDQILTALFEEGLEVLHLRKPGADPLYAERLLSLIPSLYHKRIVIHDHFYLAKEFGLMGIHLNHRSPEIPEGYQGHISCSCHSIDDVRRRKGPCDYVFLSPIFDSISKNNYSSAYSRTQLLQAAKAGIIDRKVIALGGINASNLLHVKELGFGGAAVLGDVWSRFEPFRTISYKYVIEHFKKLKNLAE